MHGLDTITLLNHLEDEAARRLPAQDPEFLRILAEEEEIERRTRQHHRVEDGPVLGGSSTPSTAASPASTVCSPSPFAGPPHDAERAREDERLKAAHFLQLAKQLEEATRDLTLDHAVRDAVKRLRAEASDFDQAADTATVNALAIHWQGKAEGFRIAANLIEEVLNR